MDGMTLFWGWVFSHFFGGSVKHGQTHAVTRNSDGSYTATVSLSGFGDRESAQQGADAMNQLILIARDMGKASTTTAEQVIKASPDLGKILQFPKGGKQ
jgi:hypothetical protein